MKKVLLLVIFFTGSLCSQTGQEGSGIARLIAARLFAARQKTEDSSFVQRPSTAGDARTEPAKDWFKEDSTYLRLVEHLKAAQAVSEEQGFYTLYARVPLQLAVRNLFLTQLHEYLLAHDRNLYAPTGFLRELVTISDGTMRLYLNPDNLFIPQRTPLTLKLSGTQAVSRALAVAESPWPFAELVENSTLAELSVFLKRYREQYGYGQNILARVMIPKNSQDNSILVKSGNQESTLDQFMQTGGEANLAYAELRADNITNDFEVQLVYLFAKNIPEGEKRELNKEFGAIVQTVGNQILSALQTPPELLPRPTSTKQQAPPLYPRPGAATNTSTQEPKPQERPETLPRSSGPAQPLPAAPTDLLSQIRAGANLRPTRPAEPAQDEVSQGAGMADVLAQAMRNKGLPEEPEKVQDSDDEDWNDEDEVVSVQQPSRSTASQPFVAPKVPSPSQAGTPQVAPQAPLAENLTDELAQRLGQRRAAQAPDEDDDQDDEAFWSDEE